MDKLELFLEQPLSVGYFLGFMLCYIFVFVLPKHASKNKGPQ